MKPGLGNIVQLHQLFISLNYVVYFYAGHTLEAQKSLFDNIRPLFTNKPLLVVANKTDIWKDNLSAEKVTIMNEFKRDLEEDKMLEMSTKDDEESVGLVKINACEVLLQHRVEQKFKTKKADGVLNRIHVAEPKSRDKNLGQHSFQLRFWKSDRRRS